MLPGGFKSWWEGEHGPPQRHSCRLAAPSGVAGAGGIISLWCSGYFCSGVGSRHGLLSNESWGLGPVKYHSLAAVVHEGLWGQLSPLSDGCGVCGVLWDLFLL